MERETVVVDASIIVKWFVEEENSEEARLLRDSYIDGLKELIAPSILPYEVLNALKYSGSFGEEELKEVSQILSDYQMTLYNIDGEYAKKTVEYAMRKGITIYDASYVALADQLNTKLYTADERLIKKINDSSLVEHIRNFRI